MKHSRYSGGFTLLELSAVMVISGLMLVAGMQAYSSYVQHQRFIETYERMNTIKASFSDFTNALTRYPCPADPTLDMMDPNAGIEDCSLLPTAVPVGTCTGSGGVCKVAGARDAGDADGDNDLDPVLTGGVPFKTLRWASATTAATDWVTSHSYTGDVTGPPAVAGDIVWMDKLPYLCVADHISGTWATDLASGNWKRIDGDKTINSMHMELVRDAWGHQFTYAVSGYMAQPDTFDSSHGAIAVQNEFTPPRTLVQPEDGAHYVLVSHGDNGAGAHNTNGTVTVPCPASPALEENNCNGGSVFIAGLRSLAPGTSYFDDLVTYEAYVISRLWDYSDAFGYINSLYNLNKGNVGVGTDDPKHKMDINGSIRGDKVDASRLCDWSHAAGNAYCFEPDILGGATGIGCTGTPGNVKLVTGIAGKNGANAGYVTCSGDIPLPTISPGGQTCPVAGQFVVGVSMLGTIICETP